MPEPVDILEALLFASDGPVELERLREVLDLPSVGQAQELVAVLRERLEREGRVLQVVDVGGGVRLVTRPEVAPWLVRLARSRTRSRLSRPALEALAIVAYRQPVAKPEIDAVRGVNSDGVLEGLLERRMIRIAGRKDSPGRPFLYQTTREFLIAFGLRDLGDLPKPEGELAIPGELAAAAEAGPDAVDAAAEPSAAPEAAAEPAAAAGAHLEEDATPEPDADQQDPGSGRPELAPGG
jgi:segregation and condensation protein B